jgi:Fur family zinc uptake transcriptional regulator
MFRKKGHNHGRCIKSAMQTAATLCDVRGARLTTLRSRVLELIWQNHQPVGAYELLDILKNERRNAQPPTIYRAYVGCSTPNTNHSSQFLICSDCGVVAEITDARLDKAIHKLAKDAGFSVSHRSLEIEGQCPNCQIP